eukprot:scaffold544_cov320-Pavlova_lutheri.AAC.31
MGHYYGPSSDGRKGRPYRGQIDRPAEDPSRKRWHSSALDVVPARSMCTGVFRWRRGRGAPPSSHPGPPSTSSSGHVLLSFGFRLIQQRPTRRNVFGDDLASAADTFVRQKTSSWRPWEP